MSRTIRGTLWRPALGMAGRHHLPVLLRAAAGVTNRLPSDRRGSASGVQRDQTLVNVPPSINVRDARRGLGDGAVSAPIR